MIILHKSSKLEGGVITTSETSRMFTYNHSRHNSSNTASNAINPLKNTTEIFEKLIFQSKVKTRVLEKILKEIRYGSLNQPAYSKEAALTKNEEEMLGDQLEIDLLDEVYGTLESLHTFDKPTLDLVKNKFAIYGGAKKNEN